MNEAASLAPPAPACAGLSETEAQRLERHRQRLLHALQAQDRRALHTAKQALLRSAYRRPNKTLLASLPRLVVLRVLPATRRLARTASLSFVSRS